MITKKILFFSNLVSAITSVLCLCFVLYAGPYIIRYPGFIFKKLLDSNTGSIAELLPETVRRMDALHSSSVYFVGIVMAELMIIVGISCMNVFLVHRSYQEASRDERQ